MRLVFLRPYAITLLTFFALTAVGCGDSAGDEGGDDTDPPDDTGEPQECVAISSPVIDGPGEQLFELIAARADIPGIADQPTTRGQTLGVIHAFDGRLHLGYGDYSENTGPIAVHAWDPQLGDFFDMGVLPTEEVQLFHVSDGSLYSPAIDPDGHQESGGVYRLDCGDDDWSVQTPIPGAVHVYDVASQGDTIYTCTGSVNGQPALLVASDDRGASWTEILRRDSAADRFSRFYFLGATPDELFVAGKDHPSPSEPFAWIRRGAGEFEAINDPPSGSLVPITLGDELVIARFSGTPGRSDYLEGYRVEGQDLVEDALWPAPDGITELIAWAPQEADEDDPERLLVLMERAGGGVSVQRSADLAAGPDGWEEIASADALGGTDEFVSMALLLNDLYLGTLEGSLYVLRELDAPAPLEPDPEETAP